MTHVITVSGHRQPDVLRSADVDAWRELAHRLGTVTAVWAGAWLDFQEGGMCIARRPRRRGPLGVSWLVAAFRRVVRALRNRPPEPVVLNGADPWGWIVAATVARATCIPWVMDVHGDFLQLPVASFGRIERWLYRTLTVAMAQRADVVRALSHSLAEGLWAAGARRVDIVPPRLAAMWNEPPPKRERGHIEHVVAVGRLVPSKGFDVLIDAFGRVRSERDVDLLVIGDGPLRSALEDRIERLGLDDTVVLAGHRTPAEVRDALAGADLFVLSSRDEALPRTVLEAAATRIPVVATDVGAVNDLAGWMASVRTCRPEPDSLAAAILATLTNPPDDEVLERVRTAVLERHGFSTNLAALAAVFEQASR